MITILCLQTAYSQEKKNIDWLNEKQKDIENHLVEIKRIYQSLQNVQFSGSFRDKYIAIKKASDFYKDEVSNIFPDLDSTNINYNNFKKSKDELVNLEKKLFILQIAIKSNESEFYTGSFAFRIRQSLGVILGVSLGVGIPIMATSVILGRKYFRKRTRTK